MIGDEWLFWDKANGPMLYNCKYSVLTWSFFQGKDRFGAEGQVQLCNTFGSMQCLSDFTNGDEQFYCAKTNGPMIYNCKFAKLFWTYFWGTFGAEEQIQLWCTPASLQSVSDVFSEDWWRQYWGVDTASTNKSKHVMLVWHSALLDCKYAIKALQAAQSIQLLWRWCWDIII